MTLVKATDVGVAVKGATLIEEIDLSLEPGEWVSVVGPNGAGKSTLLRAIVGTIPASGAIALSGADVRGLSNRERAGLISWVPQSPVVPAGMTVLDYVLLGRTPHLHPLAAPRQRDVERVQQILEELDLIDLAARMVETLSGGERQRAAIARALAQDAPVVLLDEPTSALDLGHQQEVLVLLDRLAREGDRGIITTMHDLTLAGAFADRMVMMSNGRIVASGSATEVLTVDNIARHYGAEVTVRHEQDAVVVLPTIKRNSPHSPPTESE